VQWVDTRAARVVVTVLLFAAALAFIYAARHTLVLFLFAIFFAYLLDPLVSRVEAWFKGSRGKAIAAVYLAIFGALAIALVLLGPRVARESSRLAQSLPALYEKVASGQIAWQIGSQRGWSAETEAKVQHFLASHRDEVLRWATSFAGRVAAFGRNAWWLALIPILAVFFLKDGRKLAQDAIDLVDRGRKRQFLGNILEDVNLMLAHYIRAQLTLAGLSLVVYTGVLLLLRVPYAVVLGIIGGFLEFIPIVGPLLAAVLILGIALATAYKHLIIVALFLGAWRLLQDYYNSPRIMGSHVELHPLATLFGVLVGAEILGVIGVYLSIPTMATLRILYRRWRALQTRESADVVVASEIGEPVAPRE
jgi:predicted PurR-regulated permease PerM